MLFITWLQIKLLTLFTPKRSSMVIKLAVGSDNSYISPEMPL